jgi:acetolactate synthase small subunit
MTMIEEMEAESARLTAFLNRMRALEIEEWTAELALEKNRYARETITSRIEELRAELAAAGQEPHSGMLGQAGAEGTARTMIEEMDAESARLTAFLKRMRELEIEEWTAELELETNRYSREMITNAIEELRAELAAAEQ